MLEKVTTTDDTVKIYQARDLGSTIVAEVSKGAEIQLEIQLGAPAVFDGHEWFHATIENNAGYVFGPAARGHTTLGGDGTLAGLDAAGSGVSLSSPRAQTASAAKESAQKNMAIGAVLCIVGIVVTTATYSSASQSGGSYYVLWGPVIFGGWRFLKGLVQFLGE